MLTVDLAVFMGQSNMAGRGTAADAPKLRDGTGYEFRAVTAPDRLFALEEPFGKDENNPDGVFEPGMKTGSLVSAFVKACAEITGTPIVGVSCSKGGSEPCAPYFRRAQEVCRAQAYLPMSRQNLHRA